MAIKLDDIGSKGPSKEIQQESLNTKKAKRPWESFEENSKEEQKPEKDLLDLVFEREGSDRPSVLKEFKTSRNTDPERAEEEWYKDSVDPEILNIQGPGTDEDLNERICNRAKVLFEKKTSD